ncbi:copine-3-like [Sycon ciliatum]|uniref:copine-3-like n=1 Tax=Sycon ciliatum TaxID=27933 RepID=UPI0020AE0C23|eukprot:scpid50998/ scgid33323/ Copine-3; Copine III
MAAAYPPPQAGGQSEFKTKVEIRIKCSDLLGMDVLSKSDPLCQVELENAGKYTEVGRTEAIKNESNPAFVTAIPIDYCFEELQHLRFTVWDIDDSSKPLADGGAQAIGAAEVNLGQIVASKSFKQELKHKEKKAGSITMVAEEVSQTCEEVHMTFAASHLDKKDFFGKSDPYLVFSRQNPDGTFTAVHKTEVVKNTLDPDWQPLTVQSRSLCNGDDNRVIEISCFDWDNDSADDLIGSCTTTLGALRTASLPLHLDLKNSKKAAKKKNYTNSGVLHLRHFEALRLYSFLDYVSAGCEINFVVGIDFTGSNGNPSQPTSLHYIAPNQMNQYMQALWAVGSICEQYDADKLFPAFGFGAKIPPNQQFSDIFPLTFNYENPYVQGIQGVHQAYQQCLPQVALWGPTNAAPIVTRVAEMAREAQKTSPIKRYFVLLLLTDGVLTDMEATKEVIVDSSELPLSIIIVGVGNADFHDMNVLDADDGKLRSRLAVATRDIVQFVPFRDFAKSSPAHLAKAVLAEVPQQLVEYMRKKKQKPVGM